MSTLEAQVQVSSSVRHTLASYPRGSLFYKCVAHAAEWGGFVRDAAWPASAMAYLFSQAAHHLYGYRRGYHAKADLQKYLDSWYAVLHEPNVPPTPDLDTSGTDLGRFFQDAFTAVKLAEWRKQRAWLGAWTFHGAFKLYLLHENRLWTDPAIDAVTMPMGGDDRKYSFERGWHILESLGFVSPLRSGDSFSDKVACAD